MAKIIFATTNVPFYENLPHRKSYFNPVNGIPTEKTISDNVTKELSSYYPTDVSKISDRMNLKVDNESIRYASINISQYPKGIYTDSFNFWNNINHVTIIHNDGFKEYCFIIDRSCLNLASNLWHFVFKVDVYRTFIHMVMPKLLANDRKTYIQSGFLDRFSTSQAQSNYNVLASLKFKNGLWNKYQPLQKFTSNIAVSTGESQLPWKDIEGDKYITDYQTMQKMYGKSNLPKTDLTGELRGYPYLVLAIPSNAADARSNKLLNWYGSPNILEYYPFINSVYAQLSDNGQYYILTQDGLWILEHLELVKTTASAISANVIKGIKHNQINELMISVNQAIKPFWISIKHRQMPQSEFGYKIRKSSIVATDYKGGPSDPDRPLWLGMTMITDDTTNHAEPTLASSSKLNNLCDERLPTDALLRKYFVMRLQKYKQKTPVMNDLEPYLYNDDLFYITYRRSNDEDELKISPLHYFYGEQLTDLSIFILGYQFIQPDLTYLFQWVESGIYKNYTLDGRMFKKNVVFNPELQATQDKLAQYLLENKSRINASLFNSGVNMLTSFVPGLGSIPYGGSTETLTSSSRALTPYDPLHNAFAQTRGKIGWQQTQVTTPDTSVFKIGSFIPIYSAIKGTTNMIATATTISATLDDLARQPGNLKGIESNITRQLSTKAYYTLNWIDENIKSQIVGYIQQNGYIINKMDYLRGYITSRIHYNYIKAANTKIYLQNIDINDGFKEYFDDLIFNGITFWHENNEGIILGDYTNENWESWLYNSLNGVAIDIDKTDITIKPNEDYTRKINNYTTLKNVTVTPSDFDNMITTINTEGLITITVRKEGNYTITIDATNALDAVIIKVIGKNNETT